MSAVIALSERVELQTRQTITDGSGGQQFLWNTLASVWAEIRPSSFTTGTRIGGTTTRRFVKVFIRNRSDLVLPIQVVWKEKNLTVLGFRAHKPGFMELECEETLQ